MLNWLLNYNSRAASCCSRRMRGAVNLIIVKLKCVSEISIMLILWSTMNWVTSRLRWASPLAFQTAIRKEFITPFLVYGLCQQASDDWWTSSEYRTWNCSSIGRFMLENRHKLGSASRSGVPMQNISSFVHNGIERTFTGIKNFINIQERFCFMKKKFLALLLKNLHAYKKAITSQRSL